MFGQKIRPRDLDGNQEAVAIEHFRKLIKPWRESFTEDNWPTTSDHLHELLSKALTEEGCPEDGLVWYSPDNKR